MRRTRSATGTIPTKLATAAMATPGQPVTTNRRPSITAMETMDIFRGSQVDHRRAIRRAKRAAIGAAKAVASEAAATSATKVPGMPKPD